MSLENITWMYIFNQYNQFPGQLDFLRPYLEGTPNTERLDTAINIILQKQKITKQDFVIKAKNWYYTNFLSQSSSQIVLPQQGGVMNKKCQYNQQQDPTLILPNQLEILIKLFIKQYIHPGFSIEDDVVSLLKNSIEKLVINIWDLLEIASYDRVDWRAKPFLQYEDYDETKSVCDYSVIEYILNINSIKDNFQTNKAKEIPINEGQNQELENLKEQNTSLNQAIEIAVVSRTQKWLLRNIKLVDFRNIMSLDNIGTLYPNCELKFPISLRNKIINYINHHCDSDQTSTMSTYR